MEPTITPSHHGVGRTKKNTYADLKGSKILRYFVYGLALVAISDVPSNWGLAYNGAYVLVGFLLLAVLVLPVRPALTLLLLLAVAGKDIVSSGDMTDTHMVYATASIWQIRFGPIKPSWIIFGCLLLQFLKIQEITVPPFIKRAILWFATVPIATGLIYGGFFTEHASIEVVKDLKFPLMLIASTVLFLSLYRRDRRNLPLVLSAFVGVLLARHLMDTVYLVANLGPIITEGVSRGSLDSAKGGVVFLVFFGAILIWAHRRLALGAIISIPSVLLLVAYGTRMLWITFLLGAIVLLLLLGLRRSVFFISVIVLLIVGSSRVLFMAHPESAEVISARSKTITQGRAIHKFAVAVEDNPISRIDPIRYGEFLNVFDSMGRRNAYLWGTGYGGFYEDSAVDFPLSLIGATAFPEYSLYTGRFYTAHGYLGQIILKQGLIGLFFISALWLVPGYALFKILRNRNIFAAGKPKMLHGTMLCIAVFLPTAMLQTYWSGKGLFINGLIIASCIEFTRLHLGSTAASVHTMAERKS